MRDGETHEESRLLGAATLISMLWSCLHSARRGSLIKSGDCPQIFKEKQEQTPNYEEMLHELKKLPPLSDIIDQLLIAKATGNLSEAPRLDFLLSEKQKEILSWLPALPNGESIEASSFKEFAAEYPHIANKLERTNSTPSHVLKFTREEENEDQEAQFRKFGSLLGFHGSHTENFISIIRYGFQRKYIKFGHGLFGDGIYFSSDPLVAKNFVSYYHLPKEVTEIIGTGYVNSTFGNRVGFTMVCEVIKDPEQVQFSRECAGAYFGIQGQAGIAKHYITAPNNNFVKKRFLFVHSQFSSHNKKWFLLIVLLYVVVLLGIGLIKSKSIKRYFNRGNFP